MSTAVTCRSCGHEIPSAVDETSPCPACGKASGAPVEQKPAVFRVSAADVIKPGAPAPLPLKSFEELGIPDSFRKTVEDELTKDEKLVWLGRPSKNPAVYPPKTVLVVVGAGLLVGAVLLVVLARGMPLIFPGVIGLLGLLFVAAPKLFNPANTYLACYVVTNRRAMLLERSFRGARGKVLRGFPYRH